VHMLVAAVSGRGKGARRRGGQPELTPAIPALASRGLSSPQFLSLLRLCTFAPFFLLLPSPYNSQLTTHNSQLQVTTSIQLHLHRKCRHSIVSPTTAMTGSCPDSQIPKPPHPGLAESRQALAKLPALIVIDRGQFTLS
jgi:hypothetical protein